MAKIRTVEALDDAIDSEIAWRKQELATNLTALKQSRGPAQDAGLRAAILILYAHWEGWVKSVSQLYVRYVNTQSFSYQLLSEAFLGNALKTKISSIQQSATPALHNEFAAFVQTDLSRRAKLSEDLVRTESNLSSRVLMEIVERLGLERRNLYSTRANLIDADLVNRRNTIAHGEYLDLTLEEFISLRMDILDLLELFTDEVRNAASTGRHLLTPAPQS